MPCFGGVASVSGGIDRLVEAVRPAAGRLVVLRTDGRADFGVAVRGLDTVDFGLAVAAFGLAAVDLALTVVRDAVVLGLARLADFGLAVEAFGFATGFGRAAARRTVVAATGLAVDMVLAAAVSAFAAVVIDLVAEFIACIADDIVFAEDVALVAAAVILVAADVTLVAAVDTVFAADAGVVALLDAELRVDREVTRRVDREAVLRVEREAMLRADREAGLRVVDEELLPAGLAAVLRVAFGLARLVAVAFGRLAVPDALRLTDLLRAVLAGLRRVAALVVV